MVINPLVILLAAVFIAGTVMFLPTVYPGISEITYILSTANILPQAEFNAEHTVSLLNGCFRNTNIGQQRFDAY